MRYFSMFSGIGGFELGIRMAWNKVWRTLQGKEWQHTTFSKLYLKGRKSEPICVGYSEINKYAIQIYKRHFNHKNYGNSRQIIPERLPDFDFLCAGFPCQAFSIAGKRGGFEDTRGTLFFEICRVIRVKRPRYILLENVKGLLSHDEGNTFATIITALDEVGYDLQWDVLNSKNFGVPQNRERVFIIGYIRGTSRPEVFPIEQTGSKSLDYIGAIMSKQNKKWLENGKELSRNFPQGQRVYSDKGIASNICGDAGGLGGKTGLYAIGRNRSNKPYKKTDISPAIRQGDKAEVRAVLTPDRAEKRQHGRRMKEHNEPSFTLTGQDKHGVSIGTEIRRLTPTECERLQGFPDGWTEGISDTQRYKCLGNAVTVNVIEAIIRRLFEMKEG